MAHLPPQQRTTYDGRRGSSSSSSAELVAAPQDQEGGYAPEHISLKEDSESARQQRVRKVNELSQLYLNEEERLRLAVALHEYASKARDVLALCRHLAALVGEDPDKQKLLPALRLMVPETQVDLYDKALGFMLSPRASSNSSFTSNSSVGSINSNRFKFREVLESSKILSESLGESANEEIVVVRAADGSLGLNIRGGKEYGLGIFVSKVDEGGAAMNAGLRAGDEILSIDDTPLEGLHHADVIRLLKNSIKPILRVSHVGVIPEKRLALECVTWEDDQGHRVSISDAIKEEDAVPKFVTLHSGPSGLGFSIRGGKDQGIGIYISSVTPNGVASHTRLKAGDEILEVNGEKVSHLAHGRVVSLLRTASTIVMKIKPGRLVPRHTFSVDDFDWTLPDESHADAPSSPHMKSSEGNGFGSEQIAISQSFLQVLSEEEFQEFESVLTKYLHLRAITLKEAWDLIHPLFEGKALSIAAISDLIPVEDKQEFNELIASISTSSPVWLSLPVPSSSTSTTSSPVILRRDREESISIKRSPYRLSYIGMDSEKLQETSFHSDVSPSSPRSDDLGAFPSDHSPSVPSIHSSPQHHAHSLSEEDASHFLRPRVTSLGGPLVARGPRTYEFDLFKGNAPLGLVIEGGTDAKTSSHCISVRALRKKGAAQQDGRLKVGDSILMVNDTSLEGVTHQQAVDALLAALNAPSLTIRFKIKREKTL